MSDLRRSASLRFFRRCRFLSTTHSSGGRCGAAKGSWSSAAARGGTWRCTGMYQRSTRYFCSRCAASGRRGTSAEKGGRIGVAAGSGAPTEPRRISSQRPAGDPVTRFAWHLARCGVRSATRTPPSPAHGPRTSGPCRSRPSWRRQRAQASPNGSYCDKNPTTRQPQDQVNISSNASAITWPSCASDPTASPN